MKTNLLFYFTLFISCLVLISNFELPKYDTLYSKTEPEYEYSLVNKTVTHNSFRLILKSVDTKKQPPGAKKNFAQLLSLEIFLISKSAIQFIFRDLLEQRFEMPMEEPFPYHKYDSEMEDLFKKNNIEFDFELSIIESPFSFSVLRKNTSEIIFSTVDMDIVLKHNYAEISTLIPSENLFGLGERTTSFKVKSGIYTLYNKDIYGEIEDGKGNGKQRYGSHPMYLMREKSGNYHISYLRNSLPMDVIVNHEHSMLTYKIAGGVLDFTLFLGDLNPENVIKAYHKFLGGYSMPPFWSFGFHQSRWGYSNLNMIGEVLSKYKANDIPLDVIWNDIDYMVDYMPFTVDAKRFNPDDVKAMIKYYKKKYVMISEPTIGLKWDKFEYLKKGLELDIFIKNGKGENIINRVWPGRCHFIDFFNPKAKIFWKDAMTALHKNLSYDGVWLDMNELATFESGQVSRQDYKIPCEDQNRYPYVPGRDPFESRTICPNAVHYNDLKHVQVHNYYPNMQSKVTHDFLQELIPDQFPFVLTRANAPGIGKYAAHWSGDNYGRFSFYQFSVSEVFNFNLFGAPMVGADICGFGENTREILCAKWYQMGSLYPFSRSHAHLDSYRKEPFAMGDTLLKTTQKSLQFRYSILKYYYTLFMLNNGTGTIFKPLFFEFWEDLALLKDNNIKNFFMIGSSLLVAPNFNEADLEYETSTYFPFGDWYDLRDMTRVNKQYQRPETIKITNKLNDMPPVFLRSGKIIFTNEYKGVSNTEDLDNSFKLHIAFNSYMKHSLVRKTTAQGVIPALTNYHSKKSVENCMNRSCFVNIDSEFDFNSKNLKIKFSQAKYYEKEYESIEIKEIVVYGVSLLGDNNGASVKSEIIQTVEKFLHPHQEHEIISVNEYCIKIKLTNPIKIKREEMEFSINLE